MSAIAEWIVHTCRESVADRDGWVGGEETSVYHGSHQQARSVQIISISSVQSYASLSRNQDYRSDCKFCSIF